MRCRSYIPSESLVSCIACINRSWQVWTETRHETQGGLSTPIERLYILPPIVLLICSGIFAFILANQRAQELQNLEERMQLAIGID